MRAVFIALHTAIADLKHVRIVPVSWTSEFFQAVLTKSDQRHAVIGVVNISSSPPKISGDRPPPPRCLDSPVADAEYNRAARLREGVAEFRILHLGIEAFGIAPVNFYIVDPPGRIRSGILNFVVQASVPFFAS